MIVNEHTWTSEGSRPAGEATTHVSIYTLHLSGLRCRYRHFVRQSDGAILEVGSSHARWSFSRAAAFDGWAAGAGGGGGRLWGEWGAKRGRGEKEGGGAMSQTLISRPLPPPPPPSPRVAKGSSPSRQHYSCVVWGVNITTSRFTFLLFYSFHPGWFFFKKKTENNLNLSFFTAPKETKSGVSKPRFSPRDLWLL